MARRKPIRPEVEQVRPFIAGVAKNLVDRLYGPNGPPWGTTLTELEDVALAIREALSEQLLAQSLQRQAATSDQRPDPYRPCPTCQQPVTEQPPDPRSLHTRGGDVTWDEPHTHCRRCRQAFFPSVEESGPGSQ